MKLLKRVAKLVLFAFVTSSIFIAGACTTLVFSPTKRVFYSNPVLVDPNFRFRNESKVVMLVPTKGPTRGGTGFEVYAPSGQVLTLTNHHVCADSAGDGKMLAMDDTGEEHVLTILLNSSKDDICLLTGVPGRTGFKLAPRAPRPGTYVVVYGHPHLQPLWITGGIITGYGLYTTTEKDEKGEKPSPCNLFGERAVTEDDERYCRRTLFSGYLNAIIYPGNSGSPVINQEDEVVGIAYAAEVDTGLHGGFVPLHVLVGVLAGR